MKQRFFLCNDQGHCLDELESVSLSSAVKRFVDKWILKIGCFVKTEDQKTVWTKSK